MVIGETVSHYRVLSKLGAGGMGEVYLAQDDRLDRKVAIKIFSAELASSDDARRRFAQEARAASALNHSNILTIHDIGTDDDTDFIVMEYIEGQSLRSQMERGGFSTRRIAEIGEQIASALARAHEAGIVHRDLKPENVMVRSDGVLKILDFGLAKLSRREGGDRRAGTAKTLHRTQPGAVLGTPGYMSPEQVQGQPADARSDIFSLGSMLYEMTTGRHPFSGESMVETFYAILHHEPEAIEVGDDEARWQIAEIIGQCLKKDPSDRFEEAGELEAELKRVRLSLESKSMATTELLNWTRSTWKRVPAALGVYVLASLFLVQIFAWMSDRMVLSPHLVDLLIVFLLMMAPAVALVAYLRAELRRGWLRTAQIGVTANLIVSAVLLVFLFQGKDLGAVTTSLTVQDEEGISTERVVPKSEFRRRLVVFFLENETGQPSRDWWRYAVPQLLSVDLAQDTFLEVGSGYLFAEDMAQAGYESGAQLPLSLQQKFAERAFMRNFVTGSIRLDQDSQAQVLLSLYQTRGPRLISEHVYSAEDPISMIDEASLQLKADLGVPAGHIESVRDLPVSEVWTGSIPALEMATEAANAALLTKDWVRGIQLWEDAIDQDPAFAGAYLMLIQGYVFANQVSRHASIFPEIMKHLHRLPERLQFVVKSAYYEHKKEPEKQFRVLKMWSELYPEDNQAHKSLAFIYFARRQFDQAIRQYEEILENDPNQQLVLNEIGNLYRHQGALEKSLEYHLRYAEVFPRRPGAQIELARDYVRMAEFERALEHYEKALVMDPSQIDVTVAMSHVERRRGRLEEGTRLAQEALEASKTPRDSAEALRALSIDARFSGRTREALGYKRQAAIEAAKYLPPLQAAFERIDALGLITQVEGKESALKEADRLRKQLGPPMNLLASLGIAEIYFESEDAQGAEAELAQLESWMDTYSVDVYRPAALQIRGRIHELQSKYDIALDVYRELLQKDPTRASTYRQIGRCLRRLEQVEEARENLKSAFRYSPHDPRNHYEMALIYQDLGKGQAAVEHLESALDIWKGADPEFKPAQKARAALARIASKDSNHDN